MTKDFPSHTEFYKNLHKYDKDILKYIFKYFRWTYHKKAGFLSSEETTEYTVEIEHRGWDLIYQIHGTPEPILKEHMNQYKCDIVFLIEYKSNINEWGKQIDAFFRQIKKRWGFNVNNSISCLLSFDERFLEYENACKLARIQLIVPPISILENNQKK